MIQALYTAITGRYDQLRHPGRIPAGWQCICFSDEPQSCPGWEHRTLLRSEILPDPQRTARKCKILSHKFLPDAEITVWIDGNFEVCGDLDEIVATFLAKHDIAAFRHTTRNCIYQEAAAIIKFEKDDPRIVLGHLARYFREGYPRHNGLVATGVLLRRHTEQVVKLNNLWWDELTRGSKRDQLSFNYAAFRVGVPYNTLEVEDVYENPYFRRHGGHLTR